MGCAIRATTQGTLGVLPAARDSSSMGQSSPSPVHPSISKTFWAGGDAETGTLKNIKGDKKKGWSLLGVRGAGSVPEEIRKNL